MPIKTFVHIPSNFQRSIKFLQRTEIVKGVALILCQIN